MLEEKFIQRIFYRKKEIAFIVKSNYPVNSVAFFSPNEDFLQVGYHKRGKGEKLKAHYHQFKGHQINSLQEVLYVVKGQVRVDFYTKKGKKIQFEILKKGDILFQRDLGHGFELIDDAEIFEVKQGPFFGQEHKRFYD